MRRAHISSPRRLGIAWAVYGGFILSHGMAVRPFGCIPWRRGVALIHSAERLPGLALLFPAVVRIGV